MTAKIISNPLTRRYFTDFTSSAGTLIIIGEKRYFIIDSRYYDKAKHAITAAVIKQDNYFDQLNAILTENGVRDVLLETNHISHADFIQIKEKLGGFNISESDSLSKEIAAMRAVKTAEEIEKIKAAIEIADRAFDLLTLQIKPGMTEREISRMLHILMLKCGADDLAFDTIVASGENSAIPHATPTDRMIKIGDVLLIDFGAKKDGYHSDKTLTLFVGGKSKANPKALAAYKAVEGAQKLAISLMKPGAHSGDIDKAVKQSIKNAGFKPYEHGLSHGVGLEIHEAPTVSERSDDILQKGNVISCEPGIYLPGQFGIRIEDLVFIQ
jgi:Xaa-Pro aminopeptidase